MGYLISSIITACYTMILLNLYLSFIRLDKIYENNTNNPVGKKRKKKRVIHVLWLKIVQIISLSVQAQGQITFTCVFPFFHGYQKKKAALQ